MNEKTNLPEKKVIEKKQGEKTEIKDLILSENFKKQIKFALGKGKDIEKYVRGVLTTIALNPDLQKCSKDSILKSILNAAQLDLEVDSKGHGYLVPYWNKDTNNTDCQFIAGYKGYIAKARKSKMVARITTEAVYQNDTFEVQKGSNPNINHVPDLQNMDESKITHFYAIIKQTNGEIEIEVMNLKQIMQFAGKKKDGNLNYIWANNLQEMGRKIVLKRLLKKLQLPELENLTAYENSIDSEDCKEDVIDPKEFEKETMTILKGAMKVLKYTQDNVKDYAKGMFRVDWDKLSPEFKRHVAWALEDKSKEKLNANKSK